MYYFLKDGVVRYIFETYEQKDYEGLVFLQEYDTVVEAPEGVFEIDGEYDSSLLKSFEQVKQEKKQEIDYLRLQREQAGMPWFENDVVQLRNERDFLNILGLCSKAILLKNSGIEDPVLPFQAESNITRFLTPDEMLDLGTSAMAYASEGYQIAWELKRLVDEAETKEAVEAIQWPTS